MGSSIEAALAALNRAKVRYLIVGGVAVVLHGHLRTTADLDLVVELNRDNALAAIEALEHVGYRPRAPVSGRDFADSKVRAGWIADKGMTVFSLWSPAHPGLEIDLFVAEPFDFESAYKRRVTVTLDSTTATVAGLDDLMALKAKSDRALDRSDIEALSALLEYRLDDVADEVVGS